MKLLALLLLFTSTVQAADVVHLQPGDKAPYAGYLLSDETERDTRLKLIDYKYKVAEVELLTAREKLLKEDIDIYQKRIDSFKNSNDDLAKANESLRASSDLQKVLYFLGGAAITTLIVFGVNNVK